MIRNSELVRICRNVVPIFRNTQPDPVLVFNVVSLLKERNFKLFSPQALVQILAVFPYLPRYEVPSDLVEMVDSSCVFMSFEDAVDLLVTLASMPPRSSLTGVILEKTRLSLLSKIHSRDVPPELVARAVIALGRVGLLTPDCCSSLVFKTGLHRVGVSTAIQVAIALNDAGMNREGWEAEKMKKFQVLPKPGLPFEQLLAAVYSNTEITLLCLPENDLLPFPTRLALVELKYILPGLAVPDELVKSTLHEEETLLEEDPVVGDVMEFLNISQLTSEPEIWPFPCLQITEQKAVLDIDSFSNPWSRWVRSRIAKQLGVRYSVIDSLAWTMAQDKEQYIAELRNSESPFKRFEVPARQRATKGPYFGYVRKIDLP